jgi:hypothetical protein
LINPVVVAIHGKVMPFFAHPQEMFGRGLGDASFRKLIYA